MGLWYVSESKQEGPVMGNRDHFTGIGVILDSFDNDGKNDKMFIVETCTDDSTPHEERKQPQAILAHFKYRNSIIRRALSYPDAMTTALQAPSSNITEKT